MSDTLGTYSFLPWLRQGLANSIASPDSPANVAPRATAQVQLTLTGAKLGGGTLDQNVPRDMALYGPGDIVGIDKRAIVRVEPRNWITNFEPNYLPCIEFYDEDYPWRYTPTAPDPVTRRLRPWIALVVLTESEFAEGRDMRNRPLPYVEVANLSAFPPAGQLWAWAHVHVNRSLAANDAEFTSNDMAAVLPKLQALLDGNPDLAYSRIVSPRKLAANTVYHAFLMPVFETGRLAGLGLDPSGSPGATFSAWDGGGRPQGQNFPYYFRWRFQTGATGDFETLVRLLKPRQVDKRVGTRDIDVQDPGSNLPGITDAALKGVLKLGGALRVPREDFSSSELAEVDKYDKWATLYPRPFQTGLANFINLADSYAEQTAAVANNDSGLANVAGDDDPLITPPLYGTWHALTKRLLVDRTGAELAPNKNWVHELNLDPRFRVPAGFGTRVVQSQQEFYMDAAWEQLGGVLEANRRIRLAQIAKEQAWAWHAHHVVPLYQANSERALMLTAPVHKRILSDGLTVNYRFAQSPVSPAMVSVTMRRALRPNGRLLRAQTFAGNVQPGNLLARVNDGLVSAAPPKQTPDGVTTVNEIVDQLLPQPAPSAVVNFVRKYPWVRYLILLAALVILALAFFLKFSGLLLAVAIAVALALLALYAALSRLLAAIKQSDGVREENQTPEAVADMPKSPDFTVADVGAGATPTPGATDSVEATNFKNALVDLRATLVASTEAGRVPPKVKLDFGAIGASVLKGLDPELVVPRHLWSQVSIPYRIISQLPEEFVEAMAYPVFDTPMYKPLTDLSADLFLPNVNLIAHNSITLLETNQKFIEAYMVGLNHEFARELLWREFVTDQRGSYFRQFWDVRSFFNSTNLDDEALKEHLRDITPLDKWSKFSALGDHDNRELVGDKQEEVVLVIRGELLKRYPTAVIYAHHAKWALKNGNIDKTQERSLDDLSPAEDANPPRSKVRTPLYEAKIEPDIYFFGFDLTVDTAKGGPGDNPGDDPGWFFVIKERPGEPRFGLDGEAQPVVNVWNDLSWPAVQPNQPGSFIEITNATPAVALVEPLSPDLQEKKIQYQDDKNLAWNKDMSSADLAYFLFQAPVLVAIHASEMLKS